MDHSDNQSNCTENATLGLDLSKDWTNKSLTLIRTERPQTSYSRNSQALWFDSRKNIIYCFGGDNAWDNTLLPLDSFLGFTPDGNGGGNWTEVLGFVGEKIHGTSSGMITSDNNDAYYLGGWISPGTSPTVSMHYSNIGLLQLNFATFTLTNSSELGFPFLGGVLLNVPIYGANGVLITFGGNNQDQDQIVNFNKINVFDKKEQKWYSQIAEGDIPRPRMWFCAVGVHGKGHTSYEM